MMRILSLFLSVVIMLAFSACSGGRYAQLAQMGDEAYRESDFQHAYEYAGKIIEGQEQKGKKADGRIYALAGKAAWELGQYASSQDYLEQARSMDYSDERMYVCLSDAYHQIDNLSKEITALEFYIHSYPGGKDIGPMRARLFETCLESENYRLADSLWLLLEPKYKEDIGILGIYLPCQGNPGQGF
jgi:tetratricopeptide (TPR) repeat protein